MRTILPLFICCFFFLSACNGTLVVNGQAGHTVKQAIQQFEELSQQKVLLPKGTMPYKLTPDYGLIHLEEPRLDLIYIDKKNRSETLKVYIQPATQELIQEQGDQEYTLKDGTRVIYRPYFSSAYAIEFQKNGLDYILGLSKHAENKNFDPRKLLDIANGLN